MSIVLTGIGHGYSSGRLLFSGLTIELETGSSYAVVGPSGSGKSTSLGLISGGMAPTLGDITRPPNSTSIWVFQNPHGVPGRSALDHVVFPMLLRGVRRGDAEGRARMLMREFGLDSVVRSRFGQLSGGEAQRLMLARAVAAEPDVLLVDEPTAQLDMHTAASVNDSLQALTGRECLVVIATHDEGTRASCSAEIDLAEYQ